MTVKYCECSHYSLQMSTDVYRCLQMSTFYSVWGLSRHIPPQHATCRELSAGSWREVEPSHVDMKLEEASLGIEVLNPRPETRERRLRRLRLVTQTVHCHNSGWFCIIVHAKCIIMYYNVLQVGSLWPCFLVLHGFTHWAESELMISGSHMALQNICMRIGDQPARHGDWEPFLERFDFGFTLNVTKTKSLTMQLGTTVG